MYEALIYGRGKRRLYRFDPVSTFRILSVMGRKKWVSGH